MAFKALTIICRSFILFILSWRHEFMQANQEIKQSIKKLFLVKWMIPS